MQKLTIFLLISDYFDRGSELHFLITCIEKQPFDAKCFDSCSVEDWTL